MSDTYLGQRAQCSWCGEHLIIEFEPDGERLCYDCANEWVRGEGDAAQEREEQEHG